MSDNSDAIWLDEQVRKFNSESYLPNYKAFASALETILRREAKRLGLLAMVQVRTKSIESFAEKCIRKKDKYAHPADQMTDLCGARIIVESKDQIQPFCDFIKANFIIDSANSEDKAQKLKESEFGYLSVHYIVSFKPGVFPDDLGILPALFAVRNITEAKELKLAPGPVYKAEIQVRTLLQHAWASVVHDNIYKSEFTVPPDMSRIANRTAAILEESDNAFMRLLDRVHFYDTNFAAYRTRAENERELQLYRTVMTHSRDNLGLARKVAALALSVEDWELAANTLEPFAEQKETRSSGVLRDLGFARFKNGQCREGLVLLDEAVKLNPNDCDALCSLGDALNFMRDELGREGRHFNPKSVKHYKAAYTLKPGYPRTLQRYVLSSILSGEADEEFINMLRPNLEAAIRTCREWAATKVYMPNARFDEGFFGLLLGKHFRYESLDAYAKAVTASQTFQPILEACLQFDNLRDYWTKASGECKEAVQWTQGFLLAAVVAKQVAKLAAEQDAERLKQAQLTEAMQAGRERLDSLKSGATSDAADLDDAAATVGDLQAALEETEGNLDRLQGLLNAIPRKYLADTDMPSDLNRCLATDGGCVPAFDPNKPVVIVAGGCDQTIAEFISAYSAYFEQAFEGFKGTIISGGTKAGISGIVGDLVFPAGQVERVAYLPASLPGEDERHAGYSTVRILPGDAYTPLGPVQLWIDLLASGVKPRDVRLIGVNGGALSAFEYRLALALGATVGILRDSGREASKISDDPDWNLKNLILLPVDGQTMRLFVNPPKAPEILKGPYIEKFAQRAHAEYRAKRGRDLAPAEPGLCEWDKLLPHLKESNRQQVAHIEDILARVGIGLRPVEGRQAADFQPTPEALDTLAQLEHARWNMERLLDGWKPGPRDPIAKTNPSLVPWSELDDETRSYDYDAVRKNLSQLQQHGYEAYDKGQES